jgi:hypothetical protein
MNTYEEFKLDRALWYKIIPIADEETLKVSEVDYSDPVDVESNCIKIFLATMDRIKARDGKEIHIKLLKMLSFYGFSYLMLDSKKAMVKGLVSSLDAMIANMPDAPDELKKRVEALKEETCPTS